jgi:hypothetical protein
LESRMSIWKDGQVEDNLPAASCSASRSLPYCCILEVKKILVTDTSSHSFACASRSGRTPTLNQSHHTFSKFCPKSSSQNTAAPSHINYAEDSVSSRPSLSLLLKNGSAFR